jgi:hypothetical protein
MAGLLCIFVGGRKWKGLADNETLSQKNLSFENNVVDSKPLGLPDPDPSLFVRIRILPSRSKKVGKT